MCFGLTFNIGNPVLYDKLGWKSGCSRRRCRSRRFPIGNPGIGENALLNKKQHKKTSQSLFLSSKLYFVHNVLDLFLAHNECCDRITIRTDIDCCFWPLLSLLIITSDHSASLRSIWTEMGRADVDSSVFFPFFSWCPTNLMLLHGKQEYPYKRIPKVDGHLFIRWILNRKADLVPYHWTRICRSTGR